MLKEKPVGNKLISRRWQYQQLSSHRQRVVEMKPSSALKMQSNEPSKYPHIESKAKKYQI